MLFSQNTAIRGAHDYGKCTLQRLRREGGFRSAKDFVETLYIPSSTYSRYERVAEGSERGIPIRVVWAIVDKPGCSIDPVVGRSDIDGFLRYSESHEIASAAQEWR